MTVHPLSDDERRYLLAAIAASPLHWFRSQVIGHAAAFTQLQTTEVIGALARAGLLELSPDQCARVTESGRATASGLALPQQSHLARLFHRWWRAAYRG
jgi:hypothetical protein